MPCLNNAKVLASRASELIPRGVLLINILVEGSTPANTATKGNLDTWVNRVPLPYSATLDSVGGQPKMEEFFGVPRDQFIIVDLKTMKFINIYDSDPNSAIDEVLGYLPDGGM